MNRERIAFVLVLLLLGLMGWSLFTRKPPVFSSRSTGARALPETVIPPAEPIAALTAEGARRDVFERPSADQPLPPLRLPMPALAELPALLPPPWPDPGPGTWSDHLYARPAEVLGTITDVFEEEPLPDASGDAGQEPSIDHAAAFDWVRKDALTVFYGRIVNPDRFKLRNGDRIELMEVDPKTGRNRYGKIEFEPGGYVEFGFADTAANRLELDAAKWRAQLSPVRAPEARAFISGLLDQGLLLPAAFQHAEELATALVRAAPDEAANWMTLGAVWERTFRLDQAFSLYASLAGEPLPAAALPAGLPPTPDRFRNDAGPRRGMASVLRRLGLDDLAEIQLKRALAAAPRDPLAAIALGELELETGRAEAAVARLAAARRNLGGGSGLGETLHAGIALGRAHLAARVWPEAAAIFADVAENAPAEDPLAVEARAGRVAALYLAGDFRSAAQEAATAVTELGGHPRLLYLRGIAAAAAGGTAAGEFVRDLRAAASGAPLDAALPLCALAFWLDRAGSTGEASDLLQQALELDPDLPYARWLEAHWALRDGDTDRAAAGFEALVRENPGCSAALSALGWLLVQDEQGARAEVALRSAEELAPAHGRQGGPEALVWADLALRRGLNLLALGRTTEARAAFERALDLDPSLNAARNGTAAALYAEGDLDSAVAEFSLLQDALRDAPDDPQAVHAKRWQQRIQDHAQLRLWRDSFDGRRLRPGWDTQSLARLGVEPRLDGGALAIRGAHREKGETRSFREVPALAFRSFSADAVVGTDQRGDAGLYIALKNRSAESWSFKVYRDRDGQLLWTTVRAGKQEYGKVGITVPAGEPFRVEFRLDREAAAPVLQVWVNGAVVFAQAITNLRNPTGQMAVGLYVETANALAVDAALDQVELIYAQP